MEPSPLGEGGRRPDEGQVSCSRPLAGPRHTLRPHQSAGGAADSFSLRAKSRLRRLRSDTRLRAQPLGGSPGCRKRCAHPLAPSARGLRPQAVGERTVRLPEIFRTMARFSPSAPSGHRSPSGASATSPVSGESVSQREVFRHAELPPRGKPFTGFLFGRTSCLRLCR